MEILGSARAMVGGSAPTGSSRYSFRSSSDIGTEAQKYENVLLSGIISPRKRSANWVTLSLERSGLAGIEWQSHCNPLRKDPPAIRRLNGCVAETAPAVLRDI